MHILINYIHRGECVRSSRANRAYVHYMPYMYMYRRVNGRVISDTMVACGQRALLTHNYYNVVHGKRP